MTLFIIAIAGIVFQGALAIWTAYSNIKTHRETNAAYEDATNAELQARRAEGARALAEAEADEAWEQGHEAGYQDGYLDGCAGNTPPLPEPPQTFSM